MRFAKLWTALNSNIIINQWVFLDEGKELENIGLHWRCERDSHGARVMHGFMARHINGDLKKIPVKKGDPDGRVLMGHELTAFRGALQRAR